MQHVAHTRLNPLNTRGMSNNFSMNKSIRCEPGSLSILLYSWTRLGLTMSGAWCNQMSHFGRPMSRLLTRGRIAHYSAAAWRCNINGSKYRITIVIRSFGVCCEALLGISAEVSLAVIEKETVGPCTYGRKWHGLRNFSSRDFDFVRSHTTGNSWWVALGSYVIVMGFRQTVRQRLWSGVVSGYKEVVTSWQQKLPLLSKKIDLSLNFLRCFWVKVREPTWKKPEHM